MHVLVVDDSRAMRAWVRLALEEEGATVEEAESGLEALRVLPRSRWDLLIVDVHMPDLHGLELVSFVRGHPTLSRTPLLLISTEAAERDRQRGMQLGADGYLAKPFAPDELRATVRRLLAARDEGGA
ncbi:MAG: response regulator [Myxococcota bacterium]|nr:response regulator [Myxococcota bacterium]MDW8362731.1 response regulator [Myxococcales bacterium]